MKPNDLQNRTPWTLARRAEKMNPSVIREILKVTEKPGIISLAGGLPSPKTFPIAEFAAACESVLRGQGEAFGQAALQYAASEGYGPLCDWVAGDLARQERVEGAVPLDQVPLVIDDEPRVRQRLGERTELLQEAL